MPKEDLSKLLPEDPPDNRLKDQAQPPAIGFGPGRPNIAHIDEDIERPKRSR